MTSDKDQFPDRDNSLSDRENTGGQEPAGESPGASFQLRLFVSGSTSRSQRAIQNIRRICEEHLQGQYELEIIDVANDPGQVRQRQILAVPTLIKELPPPLRKIVGDLSEKDKVLEGLDIRSQKPE